MDPLHRTLGMLVDLTLLIGSPVVLAVIGLAAHHRRAIPYSLRGWFRFPVALTVTALFAFALGAFFWIENPFVYLSATHRSLLVLSLASLAYLTIHLPISWAVIARPTEHHYLRVLFEIYVAWWLIMALPTSWLIARIGIQFTRLMFVSIILALALGLFQRWHEANEGSIRLEDSRHHEDAPHHHEESRNGEDDRGIRGGPQAPCEETHAHQPDVWHHTINACYDLPLLLVLSVQIALGVSLATRPAETSASTAFINTTAAVIMMMFPLAAWTHSFPRFVTWTAAVVCVVSTILAAGAFPFTPYTPLRLHFYETVDLIGGATTLQVIGPKGFFESHIFQRDWLALPRERAPTCGNYSKFHAVPRTKNSCTWPGPVTRIWPYPPTHWCTVETKPLSTYKGVLVVRGPMYTHFAGLFLDEGVWIDGPQHNATVGLPEEYLERETAPNEWERVFVLAWTPETVSKGGDVLVQWDEVPEPGDVPDFNALVAAVPPWVQVTGPDSRQPRVDGSRRFQFGITRVPHLG